MRNKKIWLYLAEAVHTITLIRDTGLYYIINSLDSGRSDYYISSNWRRKFQFYFFQSNIKSKKKRDNTTVFRFLPYLLFGRSELLHWCDGCRRFDWLGFGWCCGGLFRESWKGGLWGGKDGDRGLWNGIRGLDNRWLGARCWVRDHYWLWGHWGCWTRLKAMRVVAEKKKKKKKKKKKNYSHIQKGPPPPPLSLSFKHQRTTEGAVATWGFATAVVEAVTGAIAGALGATGGLGICCLAWAWRMRA